jgi:hypothetical protein
MAKHVSFDEPIIDTRPEPMTKYMTEHVTESMVDKIVGSLHVLLIIFVLIYTFILSQSRFDIVYIYFTLGAILSWTFFNGECIITYLTKLNKNADYIPGQEIDNKDDVSYVLPCGKESIHVLMIVMQGLWIRNFNVVFSRNNLPNMIAYVFSSLWVVYVLLLNYFTELHINADFHFYQNIIKYSFITIIAITSYFIFNPQVCEI